MQVLNAIQWKTSFALTNTNVKKVNQQVKIKENG